MRGAWKWVLVGVLAAGLVATSVALAASGGKSGSSAAPRADHAGTPGRFAADLAGKLGLPEAKVRSALRAVRQRLGPPRPGARAFPCRPGQRPSRAQLRRRLDRFASALASELGVSSAKVKAALRSIRAEHWRERGLRRGDGRLDERDGAPPFAPGPGAGPPPPAPGELG